MYVWHAKALIAVHVLYRKVSLPQVENIDLGTD